MRTLSRVAKGARPVTRAIASAPIPQRHTRPCSGILSRGGAPAGDSRDLGQYLRQRHVFAAEDIALADTAPFRRRS